MSSPGGRRRPLSIAGYEPLLPMAVGASKPKPPPKPKPPLLKTSSATAVSVSKSSGINEEGYFQPGGGSSFGYCLSSLYKGTSRRDEGGDVVNSETNSGNSSSCREGNIPPNEAIKFAPKDISPPPLSSLPAKFQISFEERNKQNLPKSPEPATDVLVAISDSLSTVTRRPPPPKPSNLHHRMSSPLFTTYPDKSQLPKLNNISLAAPSNTRNINSEAKSRSLERNCVASPIIAGASSTPFSPKTPGSTNPVTFAQPPPHELDYIEREYPRIAYESMERFRRNNELCDVTFIVNGKELSAHRVVLAACSQYFESMFIGEFSEPLDEPIVIEELSDDSLEMMIDFAYTSRIKITEKNVYSVFEAAELLQFSGVKGACFKFFKQQMNKSNCIRTWLFAESHNCTELLDASLKYIDCNFLDIVQGREFLDLDQPDIIVGITSREDLAITAEEQVYDAVLSWVYNKFEKRRKYSYEIFKSVRFPSISKDYLMKIVDNEPLIKEDPDLLQLLIDALESHATAMRGTLRKKKHEVELHSSLKPRSASMAIEVVDFQRQNTLLGLRVMGGVDRPQHVFRQGDKPGVFILQILEDSAAAKVGRLRAGDRILQVNDVDMSTVTHDEAIRVLKTCSDPLSFLVRHEPVPPGLKELTLVTKPGEGFGFVIAGGVNGYSGNPMDDTDEGIFISQIIAGGTAEQDDRLSVGTRILQINSISMLGKTHEDALKVLQGVLDRINLLVCHGYDPDLVPVENEAFL